MSTSSATHITNQPLHALRKGCLWLLAAILLAACSHGRNNPEEPELPRYDYNEGRISMIIHVGGNIANGSRADENVTHETGRFQENEVSNAAIIIYEDEHGVNGSNVFITAVYEFSELTVYKEDAKNVPLAYQTETQVMDRSIFDKLYKGKFHALIVANIEDASRFVGKPLESVRDEVVTQQWSVGSDGVAHNFAMSSADDCALGIFKSGSGKQNDPYIIEAGIERIAARIDIVPGTNSRWNDKENCYEYDVYDEKTKTTTGEIFKLKSVQVSHSWLGGSYLVKRVGYKRNPLEVDAFVDYLGSELLYPVSGGAPTRRWVYSFASANESDESEFDKDETYEVKATHDSSKEGYYFTIGYVQENTCWDVSKGKDMRYTGLRFNGIMTDNLKSKNEPVSYPSKESKAECYYIRHADPMTKGSLFDPMHYGVVRNNIYRVCIDKVLNSPDPMGIIICATTWCEYRHTPIEM